MAHVHQAMPGFRVGIDRVWMLLEFSISADRSCIETRTIAQQHLGQVRHKLSELRAFGPRLENFVTRCNVACAGRPMPESTAINAATYTTPRDTIVASCRSG